MSGVELAGSAPRRALWHPARLCLRHPRQGFLPFRSSDDAASDRNGIETITLRGRISTDQFQVTRNIHWFFHTRLPAWHAVNVSITFRPWRCAAVPVISGNWS